MLSRLRSRGSRANDGAPASPAATPATGKPSDAESDARRRLRELITAPPATLVHTANATPTPAPPPSAAATASPDANAPNTADAVSEAYLTDSCLTRYLRACNHDVDRAARQLRASLAWRSSFGAATLWREHAAELREQAASGKMFVLPQRDVSGCAVVVMRPGLENSADDRAKVRYLVYTLERAAHVSSSCAAGDGDGNVGGDCAHAGRFVVLVDYTMGSISLKTLPGLSMMRETVSILQGHYPERLHRMVLIDAPRMFHALYRAVRPMIDVATREKVFFVDGKQNAAASAALDVAAVPREYGGELSWEFEGGQYFEMEDVLVGR